MSTDDMRINSAVRSVLATFGVDQNVVYVTSRGGTVCLRGKLLEGADARKGFNTKIIPSLQEEIMKQKGVRKITWQVDNWKMQGTNWVQEGK